MAITVVTPENLQYFKTKQDTFNDGKFAKMADVPTVPTKLSAFTNDKDYQSGAQVTTAINAALASALTYKGVKATAADLPTTGNKTGDVWHVTANAGEYAWDGSKWEALGTVAELTWSAITGKPSAFTPSTHSHDAATTSAAGFMTAADKSKLDGIAAGANKYTHPTSAAGAKTAGLYKVATDSMGHVTAAATVVKADITALGIPAQDTKYSDATSTTAGLMSAADKSKLDALEPAVAMTTADIDAMFA